MYYVYKHTNKLNGKTYIGITCKKPERRWGPNGNRYFRCKHFFSAIQKYGWSNFSHEVLYSNLSKDDAEKKEIELIAKYKQLHMSYNISDGGKANKGWKPSQETKDKMSKTHLGKKLSDEHKRKISESGKGRIVSYSTKQKISCSKIGHEVSQETRNKIGEKSGMVIFFSLVFGVGQYELFISFLFFSSSSCKLIILNLFSIYNILIDFNYNKNYRRISFKK